MLRSNPVMAAKYAAMTSAADDAAQAAGVHDGTLAGSRPASAAAAAARASAPRPVSRAPPPCCAGSTSSSSMTPAGIPLPLPAPPPARRRQPDQHFHPAPRRGCPRPSSPMRGRASPYPRRGQTPCDTLGSSPPVARTFSPARLNAVGAGQPASPRAGRARLHYVEREDPGDGHPQPPRRNGHRPGAALHHARSQARAPAPRPPRPHQRQP